LTNDIDNNGVWSEHLPDLTNGTQMFKGCATLRKFDADLSSLTDGSYMFENCYFYPEPIDGVSQPRVGL
jgi:hypothetical protein